MVLLDFLQGLKKVDRFLGTRAGFSFQVLAADTTTQAIANRKPYGGCAVSPDFFGRLFPEYHPDLSGILGAAPQ